MFVEINGKFIPITECGRSPTARSSTRCTEPLDVITALGGSQHAARVASSKGKSKKPKVKATTQTGKFGGAVFKVTQAHSGLATLALVEGANFAGAPTYASCQTHSVKATVAALSKKTLQLPKAATTTGSSAPKAGTPPRPFAARSGR